MVMEARKNKSRYIELDLVRSTNPRPSPSPSPSPSSSYVRMDLENSKRSRSPKKWAGKGQKHMDFEFVKPHGSTTFMPKRHHVMMGGETSLGEGEGEEAMEIQASADKLFFKGQLLPLEQDPRLHVLVQTLSQGENHEEEEEEVEEEEEEVEEEEEEEEELVHHSCSIDDGVKSRSCTDASRGDLSFRSQQSSSYWGCNSEEKDSSNSSSRCSNGSSQDSLPHKTMKILSFHPQPTNMHSCNPRPNSSSKAWSWKTLLTKLWSDSSPHSHNQRGPKSSDFSPENRTSTQARGLESLGEEGPNRTNYHFIGFGFSSGDRDEKPPRKQQLDNLVKIETNAKESWHRCVAKMKRPILVYRNKKKKKKNSFLSVHFGLREESYSHGSFNMTKSLSNTPLTKSPMRDYDSIYGMGPSSSSKYIHLGCTSSCPGSLISSPHHSGVLGSSSFNNKLAHSSSSLRDLHLAIQGAIDHCKQSQCVKTLG